MDMCSKKFPPEAVRDDFVPKDAYVDPAFARMEEERLWPYVWQLACRLEEIPNVGDFYTYDIVNDSIIVVRTDADTVKAFHNACTHRGLPLTQGSGNAQYFHCRYHGWKFNLEGDCTDVIDRDDWRGKLNLEDVHLREVKVGTWGGAVFINMDPECQSLEEFLHPLSEQCDKFEFDKLRYAWYKTLIVPANWKQVAEAFNEFYHVQQTHPQLLTFTDDYSKSVGLGRHGRISFAAEGAIPLKRSPRLPPKEVSDYREYVLDFVEKYNRDLGAMVTPRHTKAAERLRTEVPATASAEEVLAKWGQFTVEAMEEDGAQWPAELTPEYMERSGLDWHMFPNTLFLHGMVDGVLWYRVRPNGTDHNSCIFDIASLVRFAPGKEPPLKREYYPDWRAAEWPMIYKQDLVNLNILQRGMRSRGFDGQRTNPVQERVIVNFHRALRRFCQDPYDHPDPAQEA